MLMSTETKGSRDRKQEAADGGMDVVTTQPQVAPCSVPEPMPNAPLFCAGCGFRMAAHSEAAADGAKDV